MCFRMGAEAEERVGRRRTERGTSVGSARHSTSACACTPRRTRSSKPAGNESAVEGPRAQSCTATRAYPLIPFSLFPSDPKKSDCRHDIRSSRTVAHACDARSRSSSAALKKSSTHSRTRWTQRRGESWRKPGSSCDRSRNLHSRDDDKPYNNSLLALRGGKRVYGYVEPWPSSPYNLCNSGASAQTSRKRLSGSWLSSSG